MNTQELLALNVGDWVFHNESRWIYRVTRIHGEYLGLVSPAGIPLVHSVYFSRLTPSKIKYRVGDTVYSKDGVVYVYDIKMTSKYDDAMYRCRSKGEHELLEKEIFCRICK